MKIGLYIALLCLAMVPAYAQNAASQDRHAIGEATTTLVPDYADRLNGLLRDIHATLQTISERMEAGALTLQQARKLKLAATQSMIARLETLSAAYDGKIASVASARDRCTPESGVSSDATTQGMRSRLTVDIRELKSTATRTARQ